MNVQHQIPRSFWSNSTKSKKAENIFWRGKPSHFFQSVLPKFKLQTQWKLPSQDPNQIPYIMVRRKLCQSNELLTIRQLARILFGIFAKHGIARRKRAGVKRRLVVIRKRDWRYPIHWAFQMLIWLLPRIHRKVENARTRLKFLLHETIVLFCPQDVQPFEVAQAVEDCRSRVPQRKSRTTRSPTPNEHQLSSSFCRHRIVAPEPQLTCLHVRKL